MRRAKADRFESASPDQKPSLIRGHASSQIKKTGHILVRTPAAEKPVVSTAKIGYVRSSEFNSWLFLKALSLNPVEGSTGNVYEIAAWRVGSHFYMTCTCEAGRNGRFCKHRDALLNGVVVHLLSGNADDVRRLAELISGTEAERLFLIAQGCENRRLENNMLGDAKRTIGFELGRPGSVK